MTAWFALDSILERQYWWAILNLWGAAVFHNRVFTMGFGLATLTGGATLFFLHGIGGIVWALIGARLRNPWLHLVLSFAAAAVWYLVLLHGFWQAAAPVVTRMSPMPATILAYVLYGAALSRNAFRARQLGLVWKT
ncbi:MAG: hypothetical protein FJW30_27270 [Acidobacteria bacterium]|nr:hypothetical protein [Acidobacteriota bacterium]